MNNPWTTRLSILTLAHVIGNMHLVGLMAMAPVIQQELELGVAQVGLLITAYYGAHAAGAMPAGALVDRLGVGWALVLANGILAAGALALGLAPSLAAALGAAAIIGIGYSLTNPATARGVLEWFPPERRATAMGIKQTGVPLGGVLAAGAGALAASVSWRLIFGFIAALTVANAFLSMRLAQLPRTHVSGRARGVIAGLGEVVRNRNMRTLFACGALYNTGQQNLFTYLTLFLREAAHASQPLAGLCLAVSQGASAIGRIGWGVASDTLFHGRRKTMILILCGSAVAFLAALAAVGPTTAGVLLAFTLAVLLGLTIASFASLTQTLAVEAVEHRLAGSAMGYALVGNSLGGILGPPLFGLAVDLTGRFASGWLLTAGLVLGGTVLLGLRFKERGPRAPRP